MDFSLEALFLSVVLILIGLAAASLSKRIGLEVGSSAWAFVFAPILAYLLLSGELDEISTAGFSAKLRDRLDTPLTDDVLFSEGVSESLIGMNALEDDMDASVFMGVARRVHVLILEEVESLNDGQKEMLAGTLATAIYQGFLAGSFEAVVLINSERKPVAVFEKTLFADLLKIPLDRILPPAAYRDFVLSDQEVRARVYETNVWDILRFPRQRAERLGNKAFIEEDASRASALEWMIESNFEVAVVVDDDGEYEGVITRRRLVEATVSDLLNVSVD